MSAFLSIALTILCLTSSSAWEVSETVNAVVGHSAELPCNITGISADDKLVILAWYKNGSDTAFFSRDLRKSGRRAAAPGGRFRLVEAAGEDRLQLLAVTPGDAGLYQCVADFTQGPSRTTYVLLNVIEPPQWLWVVQESESLVATARADANASRKIGPYYIGDTVHLSCVAFEGKPRASLSWWSNDRLLENRTTAVSEQRVRSDVTLAPLRREDHGRVVTCLAANNDLTPPLAVDIVIDMALPPELIAVRSLGAAGGRARADETLRVQCRVLGARPPPPVLWRVGDSQLDVEQNVTIEQSQRLVVSEVALGVDHTWDEARLSCCVRMRRRADEELICAQPMPLTVFYPPVLEIVADVQRDNCTVQVIKGSTVTLNCTVQANPPAYQLIWFHEDDIMTDVGGSNDTNFDPVRKLSNVTERDAGVYVCAAINTEGSTHSDPIVLDVIYPGYCEDETIAEYGVGANESVNLTCNVKANPPPTKYGWAVLFEEAEPAIFNNSMPQNAIVTDNSTFLYTRSNDTAFSTIFCWGINEVVGTDLPAKPCAFLVTDQTVPRPPRNCAAVKADQEITVTCHKGHNGGLPQKFTFVARSTDTGDVLVSITNLEPKFMIQDLAQENYKFEIIASNEKGDSKLVEIDKDSIMDELADGQSQNTVANITTLALALCGGVLLVALAACGLVLCAHDRGAPPAPPRAPSDPPLCAYTEGNAATTTPALALCGGVLLVALAACGLVLCAHDRGAPPAPPRAPSDPPLCAYTEGNAATTTPALALCGGVLLVALAACGLVLCAHDRGAPPAPPRAPSDPPLCAYTEGNAATTTPALALCGGVLLVALAACGLVLCAHDRGAPPAPPRAPSDPPLCAYTEETNCNDSDDSECNVRRTESFRRAMARYPSKSFDVRRTSSFHSARYLHDFDSEPGHRHDILRHSPSCRVHSMQNIHRKRDMDGLCDHLATQLPPEVNYVPITTNTFHTMPKKLRHKLTKESDEASVITQTSDGFSLPPPPDEFGTYRAGTRIKDMPKPAATYTTVVRKNSGKKDSKQHNNVIISPMNTVGLPVSGPSGAYSYQDENGRQVNTNPFEDSS